MITRPPCKMKLASVDGVVCGMIRVPGLPCEMQACRWWWSDEMAASTPNCHIASTGHMIWDTNTRCYAYRDHSWSMTNTSGWYHYDVTVTYTITNDKPLSSYWLMPKKKTHKAQAHTNSPKPTWPPTKRLGSSVGQAVLFWCVGAGSKPAGNLYRCVMGATSRWRHR